MLAADRLPHTEFCQYNSDALSAAAVQVVFIAIGSLFVKTIAFMSVEAWIFVRVCVQFGSFPSSMEYRFCIFDSAHCAAAIVLLKLFRRRLRPRMTEPAYCDARVTNDGPKTSVAGASLGSATV